MLNSTQNAITKIGVFYDGNYFQKINLYYVSQHEKKARLNIEGVHTFIRHEVSKLEGTEIQYCKIVDAHYFRGRLKAYEARERNMLYSDRFFDDILMREGVVTHYLPLNKTREGKIIEKGIDVWMALEAYELTLLKKFDIMVLIAGDGDFMPLVRKINNLGTRVMLLSWDFKYLDKLNIERETRTSIGLLDEVTYPVAMHEIIDNRVKKNDPIISNLFVSPEIMNRYTTKRDMANLSDVDELEETEETEDERPGYVEKFNVSTGAAQSATEPSGEPKLGRIIKMGPAFGFIEFPPNNLYFNPYEVVGSEFADLREGDLVSYYLGTNIKGDQVAKSVKLVE